MRRWLIPPQAPPWPWEPGALGGSCPSEHSALFSVLPHPAPLPPAPATESPQEPRLGELTVTDVTPSSVGLSWTVPAGEFDAFVVQYKDRDGQLRVVPVAADQRAVTVPGLEPDRKYRFLLFGIQEGKRRSPISVEAKTGERDPLKLAEAPLHPPGLLSCHQAPLCAPVSLDKPPTRPGP